MRPPAQPAGVASRRDSGRTRAPPRPAIGGHPVPAGRIARIPGPDSNQTQFAYFGSFLTGVDGGSTLLPQGSRARHVAVRRPEIPGERRRLNATTRSQMMFSGLLFSPQFGPHRARDRDRSGVPIAGGTRRTDKGKSRFVSLETRVTYRTWWTASDTVARAAIAPEFRGPFRPVLRIFDEDAVISVVGGLAARLELFDPGFVRTRRGARAVCATVAAWATMVAVTAAFDVADPLGITLVAAGAGFEGALLAPDPQPKDRVLTLGWASVVSAVAVIVTVELNRIAVWAAAGLLVLLMFSSYALRSWSPRVASLALMGA